MPRVGLDKDFIVKKAAELANQIGIENISLKLLADNLGVQSPSLYNHIKGIDDLQKEIMLLGWRELEDKVIEAAVCVSGYDALEAICRAFYKYATENKGIFNAMLWYNQFQNDESQKATEKMFSMIYKIFSTLNISKENSNHLIRTFRGFLEGFALLVNHEAFGNPTSSVEKSFDIALQVLLAGAKTFENRTDSDLS